MTDRESKLRAELESLWRVLESTPIRKLTQLRTELEVGGRAVGVAVDERYARRMLIPCSAGQDTEGLWESSAVALDRKNLVANDTVETWLVLSCLRHELDATFLRLCANLLTNIVPAANDVLRSCLQTLDAWRELLGPASSAGLTRERAIGLLGELLILEKLAAFDPVRALEAWEGPLGGRHDFRRGLHAIEAKASARRIGRFVTVHGPTQLDVPSDGSLHLSWVKFEAVPGGPLSLDGMVSKLSTALNRYLLSERLTRMGYIASDNSPEAKAQYDIVEWMVWIVDEHFPRIVPGSFSAGCVPGSVLDIKYTIDLSGSPPVPLVAEELDQVWASVTADRSL